MSWSRVSRFVTSKNFQPEKCRLLLQVCSYESPSYLGWNSVCLPRTVNRCWFSLTACSPWGVHDVDRTWGVQDADKTWGVLDADRTWGVYDADRTWGVRDVDRTWGVHDADRISAVPDTDRIPAVPSKDRTLAIHASLASASLQTRNCKYFNLVVMPLSSSARRNFSTSSAERTDKQSQIRNQDTVVATEGLRVDSGGTGPKSEADQKTDGSAQEGDDAEKKLTLYQRFKKTYKEHGKILVGVHLLTSAVWFGSFYTVARCGVDVVSFMEKLNFSEKIISPFRSGGLGDVAVAYLMYKLATPARYTVTIGGTNLAIRYLRKEGKIPQLPHEDRIRSLYKEGKEHLKRRSRVHMRRLRKKHGIKSRIGHPKDKH